MEIILYIYFAINIFLLGGYFLDSFNTDTVKEKVSVFFILFFFGGILALWVFYLEEKFNNWFDSSEFGFWWKMNVSKKYDNLNEEQLTILRNQVRIEKIGENKNIKFLKHLEKILERNQNSADKK